MGPVEEAPRPKEKKTKKVKIPKPKGEKTGFFSIFWNTVENTALKIYDEANKQ